MPRATRVPDPESPRRLGAVALLWLAFGLLGSSALAQEGRGAHGADAPTRFVFGERYCAKCHAHPEDYHAESVICRMNESTTWGQKDKHKKAFAVLLEPRGRRMGELLAIEVAKHRACLSCHSILTGAEEGGDDRPRDVVKSQQFDPRDREAEGVSCVACHGPFREWVVEHSVYQDPKWRQYSRKEKQARYGMVDLWDPATRTRACVSCHVGNSAEGKVLTHAMYAAGHPPLPGVEVSTFSAAMPNHWEYLGEKRRGRKDEVVRDLEKVLDLDKLEHTELVAVSGLVPLRESLLLFASEAEAEAGVEAKARIPGARWPDFARFDCYACHHDVNRPGWRQDRAPAGAPGRPPAPSWPAMLVAPGVEAAYTDPARVRRRLEQYDRASRDLQDALGSRPFGDKRRAIAAARALASWADEVLGDLGREKIEKARALHLLERICRDAQAGLPDYDSARQLYWAFRAIYEEVVPRPAPDDPIPAILARLDDALAFRLPSAGVQEPIEVTLASRLKAVTDFDPATFQSRFAELAGHLPSIDAAR